MDCNYCRRWIEQRNMARVTEPDGRIRILPYHRNCWQQVRGRATTNAVPMYRGWADTVAGGDDG